MDIDLPGDVSGPESEEGVGTAVVSHIIFHCCVHMY
jgi:hypothetical protein